MALFDKFTNVHVVGAGGIGVSAVARLLAHRGKRVTGSDGTGSEITAALAHAGIPVAIGADAANLPADCDVVLYSTAVPETHPERAAARERGVRQYSYPEFLGALTKEYRTICVAGTNGKSTTTAMLGLILERAGLDPTVIVGSKVATFPDGNLRLGLSDILVLESCEHQAHFLHYTPWIVVVTNVEEDHLDFYKDIGHIRETFQKLVDKIPAGGALVVNADDKVASALARPDLFSTFGTSPDADHVVSDLSVHNGAQHFTVGMHGDPVPFDIGVPGAFNVMNAAAAVSAAMMVGVAKKMDLEDVRAALHDFKGVWRRFERIGEYSGALIVSDYGHHPTAVAGTLDAARAFYPDRRIVLAFQPHHRNRTRRLFDEFVNSFDGADVLLLSEVYDVAGRDDSADAHVSSQLLVDAVRRRDKQHEIDRPVLYTDGLKTTYDAIKENARPGDVVLLMGAGDIYTLAHQLVPAKVAAK